MKLQCVITFSEKMVYLSIFLSRWTHLDICKTIVGLSCFQLSQFKIDGLCLGFHDGSLQLHIERHHGLGLTAKGVLFRLLGLFLVS